MRKYCRLVDHGDGGGLLRVVDPVDVPNGVTDVPSWAALMFPGVQPTSFVPSSTTILSGATALPGADLTNPTNFTNPPGRAPQAFVLTWEQLSNYIVGLLGGGTAGRTALGTIIKACQASASGADNYFAVYFQGQTTFAKADFTGVLADVSGAIISNGQKSAVANNWPQG